MKMSEGESEEWGSTMFNTVPYNTARSCIPSYIDVSIRLYALILGYPFIPDTDTHQAGSPSCASSSPES